MPGFINPGFRNRVGTILIFAGRHIIIPLGNLVTSWLIINNWSQELWGDFVSYFIWVQLMAHFLGWGSREYVLRGFSQTPASIASFWIESLITRSIGFPFGLMCLWLLGVFMPEWVWIIVWLASLFVYQSAEIIILYKRQYVNNAAIELLGIAMIILGFYFYGTELNVSSLTKIFALSRFVQMVLILLLIRKEIWDQITPRFDRKHIILGLPFLLSGLSGLLNSRIDLYQVAIWMDSGEVAVYQVAVSLFLYMQAGAGWITGPYLKNFFRMKSSSIGKLSGRLFMLGLGICLPGLIVAWIILSYLFHFELNISFYFWAGLMILPIYGYLPVLYLCYKDNQEKFVLLWNFIGIGLNVVLNFFLIQSLGLLGALIASAAAQWAQFFAYAYYYRFRKKSK